MSKSESNPKKVCPTCGRDDFESRAGMKRHHAQVHDESIAGEVYECDRCGETTRKYPSEVVGDVFCSDECQRANLSDINSGENHPLWKDAMVEIRCEWCGNRDRQHSGRVEKFDHHFCSNECQGLWLANNVVGEQTSNWKGGKREIDCELCGDSFKARKRAAEKRQFCSTECRDKAHRTPYEHGVEYGEGWNEEKKQLVRKRDDFECQDCGESQREHIEKRGSRLHVHHIEPAHKFDNAEERNHPDNLETLCAVCHGSRGPHRPTKAKS